MSIHLLLNILKDYGAWALILSVLIYLILNSEITFRYPRYRKEKDNRHTNST